MFDDDNENAYLNLQCATVGPWNINALLGLGGLPRDFDLLSIDIDGMDALVWLALDRARFQPKVVVVEVTRTGATWSAPRRGQPRRVLRGLREDRPRQGLLARRRA